MDVMILLQMLLAMVEEQIDVQGGEELGGGRAAVTWGQLKHGVEGLIERAGGTTEPIDDRRLSDPVPEGERQSWEFDT